MRRVTTRMWKMWIKENPRLIVTSMRSDQWFEQGFKVKENEKPFLYSPWGPRAGAHWANFQVEPINTAIPRR
jgi:hypothetical protein